MSNVLINCNIYFRARRAAKEAKESPAQPAPAKVKVEVKKFVKIGRPGYKGGTMVVHHCIPYLVEFYGGFTAKAFILIYFLLYSNQTEGPRDGTAVFTFPGLCFCWEYLSE